MTLGLLDLSIVTDQVLAHLDKAASTSQLWAEEPTRPAGTPAGSALHPIDPTKQFTINFTGLAPTEARQLAGCQVSLYLFHVTPNAAHLNTFPRGGDPRTIPRQPLALTLYYLLSAHSVNSYIEQQQAMSIALKCLHEHAITTATVPQGNRLQEFTLTLEPQTVDEIGRLWLALAAPLGLSAVYRASVIFLEPEAEPTRGVHRVLEPRVEATDLRRVLRDPPVSDPTATDTAVVTGDGFDATTIEVWIGALTFAITSAANPGPEQARVVSANELWVCFPSKTRMGRYQLKLRLGPNDPIDTVEVELTKDVP